MLRLRLRLRIGQVSAGLEAAHIQWHHVGGPDIEPNGLALCALHHKLFDLGAFTVEPAEHRVIFSQHTMAGDRSKQGECGTTDSVCWRRCRWT